MKFKSKGFTLIELLVVIAIISLLSSVVLAALRDARDKAEVAATRQYMGEIVKAIELYKSEGNNYPGTDMYLSPLIETYLQSYISFKPLSNRIATGPSYNGELQLRYNQVGVGSHSCGKINSQTEEPYFFFFYSNKELDIPKVIEDLTGDPLVSGLDKYYCASIMTH